MDDKAHGWPLGQWGRDVGGGAAVSGSGAYGGLEQPAEDDTGARPGEGASGQVAGTAPTGASLGSAGGQHGKAEYIAQHYGEAPGTGLAGQEVTGVGSEAKGRGGARAAAEEAPKSGSPKVMHKDQLVVIDDDA